MNATWDITQIQQCALVLHMPMKTCGEQNKENQLLTDMVLAQTAV